MTPNVIILPAAQAELTDTYDWYEDRNPGLGDRFSEEIESLLARIARHPDRFPYAAGHARRAHLSHFPYNLYFLSDGGELYILACLHTRRDPAIWKQRL